MTNEQKPREFWLRPSYKNSSTFYCTTNLMKYAGYQNIIHVIEYSAYEEVKTEYEKIFAELEAALEFMTMPITSKEPTIKTLLETFDEDTKRGREALQKLKEFKGQK